MRKEVQRVRNLPKVTQLTTGRGGNSDPYCVLSTAVCKAQDMAESRINSLSGLKKAGVHTGSWQAEVSTCRNFGSWEGRVCLENTHNTTGQVAGELKAWVIEFRLCHLSY